MEVFPALALPSFNRAFCGFGRGPRYNPANRFNPLDWNAVVSTLLGEARRVRCKKFVEWCYQLRRVSNPRKRHQDKLDAALCLLIAIRWRQEHRRNSIMIGDLRSGYIVAPVIPVIRERLRSVAARQKVALDGAVSSFCWGTHNPDSCARNFPTESVIDTAPLTRNPDSFILTSLTQSSKLTHKPDSSRKHPRAKVAGAESRPGAAAPRPRPGCGWRVNRRG
jgi:hypothetical protein